MSRALARFRVGQQVAVRQGDHAWVGTIRRRRRKRAGWAYWVDWGQVRRLWVDEAAILAVQSTFISTEY